MAQTPDYIGTFNAWFILKENSVFANMKKPQKQKIEMGKKGSIEKLSISTNYLIELLTKCTATVALPQCLNPSDTKFTKC